MCVSHGISCYQVVTSCFLSTNRGNRVLMWLARAQQWPGSRCAGDRWLVFALLSLGGCWPLLKATRQRLKWATGSSQEAPKHRLTLRVPRRAFPPFFCLPQVSLMLSVEGNWGRSASLLPCISAPVLQDNPEAEKRDPQELVGKYWGASRASSEPRPEQLASGHAGPTCLPHLSRGLWHFLRCLGKTPRKQFFFDSHIHGVSHWSLVSCQCCQEGFRAPPAGTRPLCDPSFSLC